MQGAGGGRTLQKAGRWEERRLIYTRTAECIGAAAIWFEDSMRWHSYLDGDDRAVAVSRRVAQRFNCRKPPWRYKFVKLPLTDREAAQVWNADSTSRWICSQK